MPGFMAFMVFYFSFGWAAVIFDISLLFLYFPIFSQ